MRGVHLSGMKHPSNPVDDVPRRRRGVLIVAIAGGIVFAALVAVGIFGLLRGPSSETSPTEAPGPDAITDTDDLVPREIIATQDGEKFALAVADRLFSWDTGSDHPLSEYLQPLVNVADAEEAPGLAGDARTYLPDEESWQELRTMQVRQWFDVDAVFVPETWETAVAQARPGQLPPGAIAYTIEGTRHRIGTWGTEPAAFRQPVVFTVFLACPPDEECRLVRLSVLGQPLK